jgi:hypothetical protein
MLTRSAGKHSLGRTNGYLQKMITALCIYSCTEIQHLVIENSLFLYLCCCCLSSPQDITLLRTQLPLTQNHTTLTLGFASSIAHSLLFPHLLLVSLVARHTQPCIPPTCCCCCSKDVYSLFSMCARVLCTSTAIYKLSPQSCGNAASNSQEPKYL